MPAVYVAGVLNGKADMPTHVWVYSRPDRLVSARWSSRALGLFVGYLLPSENVMQILGPVLAGLAVLGGLLFPLDRRLALGHIA